MVRVLLAEDMHLVRGALRALLAGSEGIEVVADTGDGDRVVAAALAHRPDVAVLDVDMPGTDGITNAAVLRERLPGCGVLILTAHRRPEVLRAALAAGATGFMPKDAPPERLAEAIRTVAAGGTAIDAGIAARALTAPPSPLTERETQALALAADGCEPREIAKRLHLSAGTVRNYLAAAQVKLDARTRLDAVRLARESGWLPAGPVARG
ncbi:response regulator [Kitasatospora cheerisanensis]|uniref:MerR family transcriptional regulator n=1 Tax=Kitasatospora cheerisanensis KCTC 2395 TaxID=1348663 RepID=A0A066Z5C7_9ACTN|nr:response regulator transcription factor [Kitasatospora cheerisanensis]KDN87459.1 MerR family transcriptional regulator [Kitasatospora cheerisanensis KCTC 2395]